MNLVIDERPRDMYYENLGLRDMIVLHTTTAYGAKGSQDWLRIATGRQLRTSNPYCLGVNYYVDRDGTVIRDIPESGWAYNTGSGKHNDSRSISIEIANLTVIRENGGTFFDIYGNTINTRKNKIYDNGAYWRGYRYYECFPDAQVDALIELVDDILDRNPSIPRIVPTIENFFPADAIPFLKRRSIKGITCHTHFIGPPNKQDMPKSFKPHYNKFVSGCGLVASNLY